MVFNYGCTAHSGGPTLVPGSPDPILSQADGLEDDLLFGGHHFDENIVQGRSTSWSKSCGKTQKQCWGQVITYLIVS